MLAILGLVLLSFFIGVGAIIFSVLAWRLKTNVMFWLGVGFTGLMFLVVALNIELLWEMLITPDSAIYPVLIFACLIVPIGFLIGAKSKPTRGGGTGVTDDYVGGSEGNSGEVTQEYLDSIINSPDEDIKFD